LRTGRNLRDISSLIFEAEEKSGVTILRHCLPNRQQLIELESCLTLGFVYRLGPRVTSAFCPITNGTGVPKGDRVTALLPPIGGSPRKCLVLGGSGTNRTLAVNRDSLGINIKLGPPELQNNYPSQAILVDARPLNLAQAVPG
jgi:hypothetical protein